MIFILLSLLSAAFLLFLAYACAFGPQRFASLPRHVWGGMLIGLPCLAWSAWHACIMLEGGLAWLHPVVWLLVPTIAILAYFYLDYLFSRALGGFFILAANEMIHCSFAYATPVRSLFSVACLMMGVMGLFMLGTPWRMRDAIARSGKDKRLGKCFAVTLTVMAIVIVALSLPALGKKG